MRGTDETAAPAGATPAPARAPAPPPHPRLRATRWAFFAVVLVHTAVVGAQPVLAGSYFAGDVDAIAAHGLLGSLMPLFGMVQLVAAVLLLRPGRGPWWPVPATLALFLAEGIQVGMGHSRVLAVHVPLGVGVVSALVALSLWALLSRPRAPRAPRSSRAPRGPAGPGGSRGSR